MNSLLLRTTLLHQQQLMLHHRQCQLHLQKLVQQCL
jgi:hypothetical protein